MVADEVNALAQNQKGFGLRPDPVAGEFKIADAVGIAEEADAEFVEVGGEVFLEVFLPRAGVGEERAAALEKLHDGPFIEHHLMVKRVHLGGAGFDGLVGLVERHGGVFVESSKAGLAD